MDGRRDCVCVCRDTEGLFVTSVGIFGPKPNFRVGNTVAVFPPAPPAASSFLVPPPAVPPPEPARSLPALPQRQTVNTTAPSTCLAAVRGACAVGASLI